MKCELQDARLRARGQAGYLTKGGAAILRIGIGEICVVQYVERLRPKLQQAFNETILNLQVLGADEHPF